MSKEEGCVSKLGKVQMPKMSNSWVLDIFEGANCFFDFKTETTCFERFYVKQPTYQDPTAFVALRLKSIRPADSLFDDAQIVMRRFDMKNAAKNLVIYDMTPFLSNDSGCPEPDDDVDELLLLKQFPDIERIV